MGRKSVPSYSDRHGCAWSRRLSWSLFVAPAPLQAGVVADPCAPAGFKALSGGRAGTGDYEACKVRYPPPHFTTAAAASSMPRDHLVVEPLAARRRRHSTHFFSSTLATSFHHSLTLSPYLSLSLSQASLSAALGLACGAAGSGQRCVVDVLTLFRNPPCPRRDPSATLDADPPGA